MGQRRLTEKNAETNRGGEQPPPTVPLLRWWSVSPTNLFNEVVVVFVALFVAANEISQFGFLVLQRVVQLLYLTHEVGLFRRQPLSICFHCYARQSINQSTPLSRRYIRNLWRIFDARQTLCGRMGRGQLLHFFSRSSSTTLQTLRGLRSCYKVV